MELDIYAAREAWRDAGSNKKLADKLTGKALAERRKGLLVAASGTTAVIGITVFGTMPGSVWWALTALLVFIVIAGISYAASQQKMVVWSVGSMLWRFIYDYDSPQYSGAVENVLAVLLSETDLVPAALLHWEPLYEACVAKEGGLVVDVALRMSASYPGSLRELMQMSEAAVEN